MGSCIGTARTRTRASATNETRSGKMRGGCNQPLKKEKPKWISDPPLTEGQLRNKRNEFWDTAPAYSGRKEIWDALKAAATAFECNDHELAQAILDGASITLPQGSLSLCYDELGNCYAVPTFCQVPPIDLISDSRSYDPPEQVEVQEKKEREEFQLKVRLSTGKDLRLCASMDDCIGRLKMELQMQEDIDVANQRWFFAGKQLKDKTRLHDTKIQKDFIIQVIVNQPVIPK